MARAANKKPAKARREGGGAKGKRSSLAARAIALLFALVLAGLAARLWLGTRAEQFPPADVGRMFEGAPRGGDAAAAPPLHDEHSAEDQEALRDILRGAESEAP